MYLSQLSSLCGECRRCRSNAVFLLGAGHIVLLFTATSASRMARARCAGSGRRWQGHRGGYVGDHQRSPGALPDRQVAAGRGVHLCTRGRAAALHVVAEGCSNAATSPVAVRGFLRTSGCTVFGSGGPGLDPRQYGRAWFPSSSSTAAAGVRNAAAAGLAARSERFPPPAPSSPF